MSWLLRQTVETLSLSTASRHSYVRTGRLLWPFRAFLQPVNGPKYRGYSSNLATWQVIDKQGSLIHLKMSWLCQPKVFFLTFWGDDHVASPVFTLFFCFWVYEVIQCSVTHNTSSHHGKSLHLIVVRPKHAQPCGCHWGILEPIGWTAFSYPNDHPKLNEHSYLECLMPWSFLTFQLPDRLKQLSHYLYHWPPPKGWQSATHLSSFLDHAWILRNSVFDSCI